MTREPRDDVRTDDWDQYLFLSFWDRVAILEVPPTNPNISASFENDLNQQQALENTKKVDAFLSWTRKRCTFEKRSRLARRKVSFEQVLAQLPNAVTLKHEGRGTAKTCSSSSSSSSSSSNGNRQRQPATTCCCCSCWCRSTRYGSIKIYQKMGGHQILDWIKTPR